MDGSRAVVTYCAQGTWHNSVAGGRPIGGAFSTRREAAEAGLALAARWNVPHETLYSTAAVTDTAVRPPGCRLREGRDCVIA